MIPTIKNILSKKLIGKHLRMSLANNRTMELWQSFMPKRKQVMAASTHLISMQVYDDALYFKNFNPTTEFEKWAAVEIPDFTHVPEGMETYILRGGLYAVFIHKGPASAGEETFRYIFTSWLPTSGYELDDREHFEILGDKYKNNEPDSEEEIWIPVKKKE